MHMYHDDAGAVKMLPLQHHAINRSSNIQPHWWGPIFFREMLRGLGKIGERFSQADTTTTGEPHLHLPQIIIMNVDQGASRPTDPACGDPGWAGLSSARASFPCQARCQACWERGKTVENRAPGQETFVREQKRSNVE